MTIILGMLLNTRTRAISTYLTWSLYNLLGRIWSHSNKPASGASCSIHTKRCDAAEFLQLYL